MFFVWILRISRRPLSSGTPISTSRSKRPKRRRAGSIEFGLLVAAITTTWPLDLSPSIRVRSCDTIRLSTSPCVFSRFGAMESTSSMKMMAGAFFSASSKALRRLPSASPAIFDMISGPLIRKKNAPVSFATARAMSVFPLPGGPYRRIPRGGFTPTLLNSCGWRRGSSMSSRICASCLRTPPMSSYPISSSFSSSSRLIASPSQWMTVSGATMQYSSGSVSTTLNSTVRMAPRTVKVSPLRTGLYASRKYGRRYTSKRLPVSPSMVSSNGRMCTLLPYLTSGHGWTDTMSPSRTLRLFLTTRLHRIFSSGQSSSTSTTHTVVRLFFPFRSTVSPRKSCSSSILAGDSVMTEFSSLFDSSMIRRFGAFFFSNMAVE
mmetsp:Transcript_2596/g.7813  ORF Transcript_2596/g.7813 Transcript_2596/m.7813 type:complete len:376 (+) Transcript_2596:1351-2478(+)